MLPRSFVNIKKTSKNHSNFKNQQTSTGRVDGLFRHKQLSTFKVHLELLWMLSHAVPKKSKRRLPQGLQDLGRQRRRWNLVLLKAQQELKHFCLSKVSTQNVWSRANSNGMEDMHDVLAKKK